MQELAGLLFLMLLVAGVWLAARNLRAALRNPPSRPYAQGALWGALLGWLIGGR
ncbi:MAG TPA: hypothetical protein PLO07_01995 [Rubrivivax sp.]|nr:hypothetical protein [Rubrivivax sp.]